MGDVVVLASPPRDPIRSSTTTGNASVRCTRASPRHLLLPWSSKYGGETDWIYNATARCMWWRVSAAGLRLHAVGRERERRAAGRLGLRRRAAGLRKVLEASGTIPINPEQFRTPKTALPYMNLILQTIPEPLVMSRIPSETPNKTHKPIIQSILASRYVKCVTLRVREYADMIFYQ